MKAFITKTGTMFSLFNRKLKLINTFDTKVKTIYSVTCTQFMTP